MSNREKKNMRRVMAVSLAGVICASNIGLATIQAADISTEKEEVIYVNLEGDGNVKGVYAVNIFSDSNIVDYGDYTEVKNMNTSDAIEYENGEIQMTSTAAKTYYEGIMDEDTQIPWKVAITYKMDGKEYSADEIAGMSGALEINLAITENTKAKEEFFENYAVQATVKLDTDICENIKAEGATAANAGNTRQLTYTILPGKEKDITITADVKDFEMDSIAINGVRLNLGVSSDSIDTSTLDEKIAELQDAATKLDDGAQTVSDGAEKINNGADTLESGIKQVQEALDTLNANSGTLNDGSAQVLSALTTIQSSLNNVAVTTESLNTLSSSSTQIKAGIDELVSGLQNADAGITTYQNTLAAAGVTDVSALVEKNQTAIASLGITTAQREVATAYSTGGSDAAVAKIQELAGAGDAEGVALVQKMMTGDTASVQSYITQAVTNVSVEALLQADSAYIAGSSAVISSMDSALDANAAEKNLMTGALSLQSNYQTFDAAVQNMVQSLSTLAVNMTELKSGIDTLVEKYGTLNTGVNSYTNAVNQIVDGYTNIYNGAVSLTDATAKLYDGTQTLTDGTGEFASQADGMEEQVDEKLNEAIDSFTGADYEVTSFVSDKNTNVNAVQFVITVPAVQVTDVADVMEETVEKTSFIDKLLNLFR